MNLNNIQYDDLTDVQKEIADTIGMEGLIALVKRFGGNGIYLPYFEAISRRARNRRIVSDRNAGMSCKQLSIKYHLTAVQILNILNTAKDSNKEAKHQ